MKTLVVGGAGYIGSHVVLALRDRGIDVTVLDNLERGCLRNVHGPLIQADLRDRPSLEAVFRDGGFPVVYHFAAYAYIGESVEKPVSYFQNNVTGTANLLDVACKYGLRKFIFSSTCATYGEPVYLPIDEEHPQRPINPYGETKLSVERLLEYYRKENGMATGILRYFNAAGCDPSGRAGEYHTPETHLIPLAIDAAYGRRGPLSIFGDDYQTKDGTCVRDYVHVSDLARAHLLVGDSLSSGQRLVYNLGSGEGYTVREIMSMIEKVSGRPVPYRVEGRREGDPAKLVASTRKAYNELGWRAEMDLESIVRHAIATRL